MFCTRCGANNLDTDQFCRSCSAPLTKPGVSQGPGVSSGSPQHPYPYSTPGAGQQHQPSQGYPPYPGYQAQPQYGQPQYGQPQYGGYASQATGQQGAASGRAIAALILSILSVIMCCAPMSIIGLVLGKMEMNAIQEGRAPRAGESIAKVGFYLGIVATALSLLVAGLYFLGALASLADTNY